MATTLPDSYYHSARPAFYGALAWPSLGSDLPGGTIPAKQRYLAGSYVPDPPTGVTPTPTRTRTATSGGTLPTATPTRTATSGGTLPTATRTHTPSSASPTSTAGAPTGLKVQYRNVDSYPADSHIRPHLQVVNGGSASVALSALKLRYYYTKEGTAGEQFWCDWAQLDCANISGSFGAGYLEVGFTAGAGSLGVGQSTGEIQTRFNKLDWSNYDESNDYSVTPYGLTYADQPRVTLHWGGALIWGTPPA